MRTAEGLVIDYVDEIIGIIKARQSISESKNLEGAYVVALNLCDCIKHKVWELIDSNSWRIDRELDSVLKQVLGQIKVFKCHPYITEEEIPFYDEFVEVIQCIRTDYSKLKKGEKQCKRTTVTLAI